MSNRVSYMLFFKKKKISLQGELLAFKKLTLFPSAYRIWTLTHELYSYNSAIQETPGLNSCQDVLRMNKNWICVLSFVATR